MVSSLIIPFWTNFAEKPKLPKKGQNFRTSPQDFSTFKQLKSVQKMGGADKNSIFFVIKKRRPTSNTYILGPPKKKKKHKTDQTEM